MSKDDAHRIDPQSSTAAGEWCQHQRPDLGAGAGLSGGTDTIFRKASPDQAETDEFDRQARALFPDMQILTVPRSFTELLTLRQTALRDETYWRAQGLAVNESTLRISPSTGTLTLNEIQPGRIAHVDELLRQRYGPDAIRASSAGPALDAWQNRGTRHSKRGWPPLHPGQAATETPE